MTTSRSLLTRYVSEQTYSSVWWHWPLINIFYYANKSYFLESLQLISYFCCPFSYWCKCNQIGADAEHQRILSYGTWCFGRIIIIQIFTLQIFSIQHRHQKHHQQDKLTIKVSAKSIPKSITFKNPLFPYSSFMS